MGNDTEVEYLTVTESIRVANITKEFNRMGRAILRRRDSDENYATSPLCITLALTMLLPGAADDTLDELVHAIGLDRPADQALPLISKLVLQMAHGRQSKGSELNLAAGCFFDPSEMPIKTEFMDSIKRTLLSECTDVDFSQKDRCTNIINEWARRNTRGMIPQVATPQDILPDTSLMLVNALYMQSNWQDEFDPEVTEPGHFYRSEGSNGDSTEVQLMHGHFSSPVIRHSEGHFKSVVLPMKAGIAFQIILPEPGYMDEVIRNFDGDYLNDGQAISDEVDLVLPRFRLESVSVLGDDLRSEGLTSIFDRKLARFPGIVQQPEAFWVGEMLQRVRVDLSEEGVKAAAVISSVILGASVIQMKKHTEELRVDRPFLFRIFESGYNLDLFLGIMTDPSNPGM